MNITNNGRVNIEGPNIDVLFSMKDKILVDQPSSFRDALTGIFEETPLSIAFFSEKNMQIIQNGIRAGVYNKSNGQHIICPQNYDVIKTIMRSMFLQHSLNLHTNYREQILNLNQLVIDYSVKQIYGEIEGYMKYKRDASNMYTLMSHPTYANNKGKTLELKKWF
jgi:hypothetical protein